MSAVASSMRPSQRCAASNECLAQDHRESANSAMCQGYVFGGSRASLAAGSISSPRVMPTSSDFSPIHRTYSRSSAPPHRSSAPATVPSHRQPIRTHRSPLQRTVPTGQRIGRPMVWIASTNWVSDVAEDLLSAGGSEDPVADTESAAASAIEPVGARPMQPLGRGGPQNRSRKHSTSPQMSATGPARRQREARAGERSGSDELVNSRD